MNNEFNIDLEGRGGGVIELLSLHFPREIEGNHENPVRMASDPVGTRTEHLSNTSLQRRRTLT
jgi:hypothetical protein